MTARIAPLVRVLGGVVLALLCAQAGLQLNGSEWNDEPAPSLDDVAAVLDETSPAIPRKAPSTTLPADRGAVAAVPASCGSSCSGVPTPVELSWGSNHAAAALVSAPPADETPPARGAEVAVAFAQAAAQTATPATAPVEHPWTAQPVLPTRPGGLWIEPVVSALFDPDPTPPAEPATDPTQPTATPPQDEGTTPMAVPLDAHTTPESADPSAAAPLGSAGTPFKRNGLPSDKASGRAPVPLAATPVWHAYGSPRGPAQGSGTDPAPDLLLPVSDAPAPQDPASGAPYNPPEWIAPVLDQGSNPGPTPGPTLVAQTGPQPGAPSPWLPLLNDTARVVERIASGAPQPGDNPLLAPRFELVALPSDLLVAAALVTEPGGLALLAIAALGLASARRTRRR